MTNLRPTQAKGLAQYFTHKDGKAGAKARQSALLSSTAMSLGTSYHLGTQRERQVRKWVVRTDTEMMIDR